MHHLIKSDLYRYTATTGFRAFFKCFYYEPGFRFCYFMRNAARYSKFSIPGFFYRVFYVHYTHKYGFQIPKEVQIGKGLMIKHFGCIVVNPTAVIGENCYLSHGITIGQTNRGKLQGVPVLGNRVWMGTNSVVVGNIKIGDNVLIAPNAFVNMDVPANSIVIGNPARIIPNENATDGYIFNAVP